MIESVEDFRSNLNEIDILMSYARANQKSVAKYKLFIKTAIVLLCSHFEVFIEAFISEHVDVLKSCYNSGNMPQFMKDNYIDDTLKLFKSQTAKGKNSRQLKALFKLHDSVSVKMSELSDLELNLKFSIGKHGQKEVEHLFVKFGLDSFVESQSFIKPFKLINSAIGIRNNIIHEGSAPTLTYEDLVKYKEASRDFVNGLQQHILTHQEQYYGRMYYM